MVVVPALMSSLQARAVTEFFKDVGAFSHRYISHSQVKDMSFWTFQRKLSKSTCYVTLTLKYPLVSVDTHPQILYYSSFINSILTSFITGYVCPLKCVS